LAFCTLTPQAKPLEAQKTLDHLMHCGLLWDGTASEIAVHLHRVRFRYTKAASLVANREVCLRDSFSLRRQLEELQTPHEQRRWVVHTMRGIGWKEASHFLRNTGFGFSLAILDRHVLRMLQERFGCSLSSSLDEKRYLLYETKLHEWAEVLAIPFEALDFVIFYAKTGIVFK